MSGSTSAPTSDGSGGASFQAGLVVISGPSGSGKTTIVERLGQDPRVEVAVTATTRSPRQGEVDGEDYYFLSREEFQRRVDAGDFLEYNEVFRNGHLYGSLRGPLDQALSENSLIYVLEIDVEGGVNLLERGFEGRFVFILPPSREELIRRLGARGTETAGALEQRLAKADVELALKDRYQHVVVNDDLDRALSEVRAILGLDHDQGGPERSPGG